MSMTDAFPGNLIIHYRMILLPLISFWTIEL